MAVASGATAWCRSFDTPDYLIPYYLRDVRTRFQHYATEQKHPNGPRYLSISDFVRSLLGSPKDMALDDSATASLRDVFASIDSDGDELLSFSEYRLLMALLTSKLEDFRVLFDFVDEERRGRITLDQFGDVLRGATEDEDVVRTLLRPSTRESGIICKLFGNAQSARECTYSELHNIVNEIKVAVWKTEFDQFDPDHTGCIPAERFAELIANHLFGAHLPYHLVSNIKKLHGTHKGITIDMWLGLHEIMQQSDTVAHSIQMYSSSGLPLTRKGFERAVGAAGLPPLSPATLDILFVLFDRNGDGVIQTDELFFIMKQKVTYHYRSAPKMKTSLPRRLLHCTTEAFRTAA